jgi:hypothetical protein
MLVMFCYLACMLVVVAIRLDKLLITASDLSCCVVTPVKGRSRPAMTCVNRSTTTVTPVTATGGGEVM